MISQKNLIKDEIFPDIYLVKNYLNSEQCGALFAQFLSQINWQKYHITVFGKTYLQPRLCSFIGDENLSYTYSKLTLHTKPWLSSILDLKKQIESDFSLQFNSVLANLYRDGNDSNGWHSDNEGELGLNPVLASLSFGGSKPLHLRNNNSKLKFIVDAGDLILFSGSSQHESQHMIPKSKTYTEPRINLTFRQIIH